MPIRGATAISCPNIAFIKYWGNRNEKINLPENGSISMNLAELYTRTSVEFDLSLPADHLSINGKLASGPILKRVSDFLDNVRRLADISAYASVTSENNFPAGAGIASSASAFAALALSASTAAGLQLSEPELSRLARIGSGSACRSVPGGFAEWYAGESDESSYAVTIAPPDHWNLVDCIAVVSESHKPVGSADGHTLARTSPFQEARVTTAPGRIDRCRNAILARDFEAFAEVTELDSNMMHAVMMTSKPALLYWLPATLTVMQVVAAWRRKGIPAFYTIDAGPNVHVFCEENDAPTIFRRLTEIPGVSRVIIAHPGPAASLIDPACKEGG